MEPMVVIQKVRLPRPLDPVATLERVGDRDEVRQGPRSGKIPCRGTADPGRRRPCRHRWFGRVDPVQVRLADQVAHPEHDFLPVQEHFRGTLTPAHRDLRPARQVRGLDLAVRTGVLHRSLQTIDVDQFAHAVQR
jgi:hypothetical protein